MQSTYLIFPMLAMVLLTVTVLRRLFLSRVRSVREGLVPASYFGIYQGSTEPEYAAKPSRHFVNLFEAPTLFYAACLAGMIIAIPGAAFQVLAWCYVATRIAHTYIHLGTNRLRFRIRAYFSGW